MSHHRPATALVLCLLGSAFLLPVWLVGQTPVVLDSLDLEELANVRVDTVVGASRYAQKESEAPASVTIVSAAEIHDFGYTTLAELLGGVRGYYVNYDRTYSYLGARGFNQPGDYNSRTLLLVNGHRFNDNIYGGAVIDGLSPLDLALVDHVEIIRGPSSSLYGTSAFFGVVNLVTRSGADLGKSEAEFSVGSQGAISGRVTTGGRTARGLEYLFSATWTSTEGDDSLTLPAPVPPFAPGRSSLAGTDFERNQAIFASARQGPFSFEGAFTQRVKGIPTGSFGALVGDPTNRGSDERSYVRLNYRSATVEDTTLDASVAYDLYEYEGHYLFAGSDWGVAEPTVVIRDWAIGRGLSAELQATRVLEGGHTLIAGFEARENLTQNQGNEILLPPQVNFRKDTTSSSYSPFVQGEWRARKDFIVNAGVRYDRYSTFGGTTNPRLGLIWAATPETSIKAVAGTAFRAPTPYENYYNSGSAIFRASNHLGPERIATLELSAEHRVNASTDLTASIFQYDLRDLIVQTVDPGDGSLRFQNIDRARTKGGELELTTRSASGASLTGSASYQEATNATTGNHLSYSPRVLAKVRAQVGLLPHGALKASVEARYASRRNNSLGEPCAGAWLTDVSLVTGEIVPGLRARIKVSNLFDRRVSDPAPAEISYSGVPQDGRLIRLTLEYRY